MKIEVGSIWTDFRSAVKMKKKPISKYTVKKVTETIFPLFSENSMHEYHSYWNSHELIKKTSVTSKKILKEEGKGKLLMTTQKKSLEIVLC